MAAANAHGMRLVLTLTNYLSAYGGAQQWVQWFNGTSIFDFWADPSIRHVFSGNACIHEAALLACHRLTGEWACCMAGMPSKSM